MAGRNMLMEPQSMPPMAPSAGPQMPPQAGPEGDPQEVIQGAAQRALGRPVDDPQEAVDAAWAAQPTDDMAAAIEALVQMSRGQIVPPWAQQQQRPQQGPTNNLMQQR